MCPTINYGFTCLHPLLETIIPAFHFFVFAFLLVYIHYELSSILGQTFVFVLFAFLFVYIHYGFLSILGQTFVSNMNQTLCITLSKKQIAISVKVTCNKPLVLHENIRRQEKFIEVTLCVVLLHFSLYGIQYYKLCICQEISSYIHL